MKPALILLATGAILYAMHRLALWAEARGWIYYLRSKTTSSTLGNAFLEVQSLIEPGKRHLVEIRQEEAVEEDDQGEPPDSAMNSTSKKSKKEGHR
jgi:hypothetical protein